MTEDKFGVPESLFLVHVNSYTTKGSVVLDGYRTRLLVDVDRYGIDVFGVERVAIDSVYQDFIENFQERWGILNVLLCEARTIENPIGFTTLLNWTYVGIRSLENMFNVG